MKLERLQEAVGKCEDYDDLIGLPKPVFVNNTFAEDPDQPLMSQRELAAWLDENKSDLWWDNTQRLTRVGHGSEEEEFVYRGFR